MKFRFSLLGLLVAVCLAAFGLRYVAWLRNSIQAESAALARRPFCGGRAYAPLGRMERWFAPPGCRGRCVKLDVWIPDHDQSDHERLLVEWLEAMPELPLVDSVHVYACNEPPPGFFAKLAARCPQCRTLIVEEVYDGRPVRDFAPIALLTRLEALYVCLSASEDEPRPLSAADWRGIASLPSLDHLHLARVQIRGDGLEGLARCPRLTSLTLSYCRFATSILEARVAPALESLEVNDDPWSPLPAKALEALLRSSAGGLRTLILGDMILDSKLPLDPAVLRSLETLGVEKGSVDPAWLRDVAANAPRLRSLKLDEVPIDHRLVETLLAMDQLKSLKVDPQQVSHEELQRLKAVRRWKLASISLGVPLP